MCHTSRVVSSNPQPLCDKSLPTADDLPQPLPPRPEPLLETAPGRPVVRRGLHQVVREVLLGHDTGRVVVRVAVALAVPEASRAGVPAAAQVRWHGATLPGPDVRDRGVDAGI